MSIGRRAGAESNRDGKLRLRPLTAGPGNRDDAIAVLRFRYAPPTAGNGKRGHNALTFKPDHLMGADQSNTEGLAHDVHPDESRLNILSPQRGAPHRLDARI